MPYLFSLSGCPTRHTGSGPQWNPHSDHACHCFLRLKGQIQFHTYAGRGKMCLYLCILYFYTISLSYFSYQLFYFLLQICDFSDNKFRKYIFSPVAAAKLSKNMHSWVQRCTISYNLTVYFFLKRVQGRCRGSSFSHGECSRIRSQ